MTSQDEKKFNYFPEENKEIETDYSDDTANYFAQVQTPPGDEINRSPENFDYEEQRREEEYAAEAISPADIRNINRGEQETHMEEKVEAGWGWAAIILSLIALFNIWPLVMGIAGIVVGVMAKRRGADTLGNIAVVAGIAAIVIHLIIDAFV